MDSGTSGKLDLLPPPLAGEGWGGGEGKHSIMCVLLPCPSPASGGGEDVALSVTT